MPTIRDTAGLCVSGATIGIPLALALLGVSFSGFVRGETKTKTKSALKKIMGGFAKNRFWIQKIEKNAAPSVSNGCSNAPAKLLAGNILAFLRKA